VDVILKIELWDRAVQFLIHVDTFNIAKGGIGEVHRCIASDRVCSYVLFGECDNREIYIPAFTPVNRKFGKIQFYNCWRDFPYWKLLCYICRFILISLNFCKVSDLDFFKVIVIVMKFIIKDLSFYIT
jgi:hypothetical protein